ncbi:protein of unknown function [Candidatus Methylomirabilis oxygeniifera]|uniref:Uncharacterized protein n=1 Tax=Methylomirabilis oxygeniifera TaxID=671143 RepID=D5MLT2_METO1|nr:protein of unknown function [Candidatus Methylomirabilis oxyfera]
MHSLSFDLSREEKGCQAVAMRVRTRGLIDSFHLRAYNRLYAKGPSRPDRAVLRGRWLRRAGRLDPRARH